MTTTSERMMFVNLPVEDLDRSMNFFRRLGFEFNPQFTDEKAACMVLSDKGYVMLLTREFFGGFTKRSICETKTHSEALIAISCRSREEVDRLVNTAVSSGGSHAVDSQDHGWMYGWSFYDPDGHHWEVLWMDPNKSEAQ